IFLGEELRNAFEKIATGKGKKTKKGLLPLGTDVLPHLPRHGGDRNRTSPFAFTGNKFEFRALGSSMSLGFVNTVLNTIVAESIDRPSEQLAAPTQSGVPVTEAVLELVKETYGAHKRIVFGGDNY